MTVPMVQLSIGQCFLSCSDAAHQDISIPHMSEYVYQPESFLGVNLMDMKIIDTVLERHGGEAGAFHEGGDAEREEIVSVDGFDLPAATREDLTPASEGRIPEPVFERCAVEPRQCRPTKDSGTQPGIIMLQSLPLFAGDTPSPQEDVEARYAPPLLVDLGDNAISSDQDGDPMSKGRDPTPVTTPSGSHRSAKTVLSDHGHVHLDMLGVEEHLKLKELHHRLAAVRCREDLPQSVVRAESRFWGIDLDAHSDARDIILLKFIRAAHGDVESAALRFMQTLVERCMWNIDEIHANGLKSTAEPFKTAVAYGGHDRCGRPVVASRVVESPVGNRDDVWNFNVWAREDIVRKLTFKPREAANCTFIVDLGKRVTPLPGWLLEGSDLQQRHYPETTGRIIYLVSSKVRVAVASLFSWLSGTRRGSKFVAKTDLSMLFDEVPPEAVPVAYGGLHHEFALPGPASVVSICSRSIGCCMVSRVKAKQELGVEVLCASCVRWELRVCRGAAVYQVLFLDGRKKHVVSSRSNSCALQVSDGVMSGKWAAPGSGRLVFRFCQPRGGAHTNTYLCRAARCSSASCAEPEVCLDLIELGEVRDFQGSLAGTLTEGVPVSRVFV